MVLATIVRLLDTTFVRIGNEEYARDNRSFGLTTLKCQHAGLHGSVLQLKFRGKSGREHAVKVDDVRVARIVRQCRQLPGQDLFQFFGPDGSARCVGSGDVNDYLERHCGQRFTAKDFRTWHGSVQAMALLCSGAFAEKRTPASRLRAVVGEVAQRLGNTVAVCRKSYIHPDVLRLAEGLPEGLCAPAQRRRGLSVDEIRLMHLLEAGDQRPQRLAMPAKAPARTAVERPRARVDVRHSPTPV
jgi:DNA topoisomerase-1